MEKKPYQDQSSGAGSAYGPGVSPKNKPLKAPSPGPLTPTAAPVTTTPATPANVSQEPK